MATTMSRDDVLNTIAEMSVMDVVELVKAMEEKFGVSAAQAVAVAAPGAAAAEVLEEKTEFTVKLTSFGGSKIGVIKVIRSLTTLPLKEAKDLVEGAPSVVKENVSKEDAEKMKQEIEKAGGTVSVE